MVYRIYGTVSMVRTEVLRLQVYRSMCQINYGPVVLGLYEYIWLVCDDYAIYAWSKFSR